jgi:hypothetical protein
MQFVMKNMEPDHPSLDQLLALNNMAAARPDDAMLLTLCRRFHDCVRQRERFLAMADHRPGDTHGAALDVEAMSVVENYVETLKHVTLFHANTLEGLAAKAGVLHLAKRLEFEGTDGNLSAAEDEDLLALSVAEDCMMLSRSLLAAANQGNRAA